MQQGLKGHGCGAESISPPTGPSGRGINRRWRNIPNDVHSSVLPWDGRALLEWLDGRFSGKPAPVYLPMIPDMSLEHVGCPHRRIATFAWFFFAVVSGRGIRQHLTSLTKGAQNRYDKPYPAAIVWRFFLLVLILEIWVATATLLRLDRQYRTVCDVPLCARGVLVLEGTH